MPSGRSEVEELAGKVVAITGGASGIGRALADAFGAAGSRVALADVEPEPLARTVEELADAGIEAAGWECDVSDDDQVHAFATATFERFGTAHVICNNAGVGGAGGLTWDVPLAGWEWTIGVNLMGVVHGIRAFVPRLVAQGEGHVVNTASLAGLKAAPFMAAYNATKHAVVAISESLAHECAMTAPGVGVSVLCPAFIRTRIADSGRNWPTRLGENPSPPTDSPAADVMRQLIDGGLEPSAYAARVVEAVRTNRFFVLSDDAHAVATRRRLDEIVEGTQPGMFTL
jgi:NAD(P)-dependent dehydrogenase (short-subunit alcohol dehydrogenase family)